jgi:hypothetical protein
MKSSRPKVWIPAMKGTTAAMSFPGVEDRTPKGRAREGEAMFLIVAGNKWDVREDGDFMTLRCAQCEEELVFPITSEMSKGRFDAVLRAHNEKHLTSNTPPTGR